ncbi:MAG: pyrroline-5-carboxylate reductase [Alphaproteobacteria bacterium]|nr:pyrroline-5-carboxylate reductase [Alphaproteobacteria bacterium]
MNLLLVGCGKMGQALLTRWIDLKLCTEIHVIEPAAIDAAVPHVHTLDDLPDNCKPDVIIFAVKPQVLPDMTAAYKRFAAQGALFISIAAGKPISFFESHLGTDAAIVRAMPNTPAAIGQGMTVACANAFVNDAQKKQAQDLLSAVGDFVWVPQERLLDPVTALSGSGPAYVFLLIEAMAAAGEKIGLDPAMAARLARQTVIGSAALARETPDTSAASLRENVTSPGGTTAAALAVLMRDAGGMQALFDEALAAAAQRAEELSR